MGCDKTLSCYNRAVVRVSMNNDIVAFLLWLWNEVIYEIQFNAILDIGII